MKIIPTLLLVTESTFRFASFSFFASVEKVKAAKNLLFQGKEVKKGALNQAVSSLTPAALVFCAQNPEAALFFLLLPVIMRVLYFVM